jgi:hypothetical protein
MAKETVQGLARDIIIDIGDTYHKGCELLSESPTSMHWHKAMGYVATYPPKMRRELKAEILRLVNGWSAIYRNTEGN